MQHHVHPAVLTCRDGWGCTAARACVEHPQALLLAAADTQRPSSSSSSSSNGGIQAHSRHRGLPSCHPLVERQQWQLLSCRLCQGLHACLSAKAHARHSGTPQAPAQRTHPLESQQGAGGYAGKLPGNHPPSCIELQGIGRTQQADAFQPQSCHGFQVAAQAFLSRQQLLGFGVWFQDAMAGEGFGLQHAHDACADAASASTERADALQPQDCHRMELASNTELCMQQSKLAPFCADGQLPPAQQLAVTRPTFINVST